MFQSRRGSNRQEAGTASAGSAQKAERDEIRLLGRISAGDMRAFEELYRVYYPRLMRFLERVTRRPGMVEEVLNDTMLVVWNRADGYNGSSKVSTWIFAIAFRKALKALQRFDDPVDDEPLQAHADDGPGPDMQVDLWQLREALTKALDGLSADHRAVVDLAYFHGLGYREIAQIVSCPVDTVKTRMFHARRKLKVLLAGDLEDWL
ncbi:MAG TPA: sigma-70 family RNA polymerase sigma factor [Burkholderiaceae bacterium]|jgi:RNA polymerase sigma factor (sigma-70 family)|nr:sigma-70 family RNA polymerase sigma factor [Burkholderiaceae bacterium]